MFTKKKPVFFLLVNLLEYTVDHTKRLNVDSFW